MVTREQFTKAVVEAVNDWIAEGKNPNEVLGVLADTPDHCAVGRIDRGSQKDERVTVTEIDFDTLVLDDKPRATEISNLYGRFYKEA